MKQHCCVAVTFLYYGQLIKHFMYIPKKEGLDYIEEAKRIIDQDRLNGKLIRYVRQYNHQKNKPALKVIAIIFAIIALFFIVLLICDYLAWGGGKLFA